MPQVLHSLDDTLAIMRSQFGVRWPNPWWPSGVPSYNDCAACVSWALFGLNSYGNPYYTYVSQIQNFFAAQGRRQWGNSDIQVGDVLAFSWSEDPSSFDHTEICVGVGNGVVTSRGTNSSGGDDMRDRTRSAAYVVSHARPAYPGTSVAGLGAREIEDMDATQANQLQQIYNAIFAGGPSMPDRGQSIGTSLADILRIVNQPVERTINGKVHTIPQIQDNADTNTMVRDLLARGPASVDVAELAKAVVEGLTAAGVTAPTAEDVSKKVLDGLAARLAS